MTYRSWQSTGLLCMTLLFGAFFVVHVPTFAVGTPTAAQPRVGATDTMTIVFVGDIMLDRNVRTAYAALKDPADAVDPALATMIRDADIAVANLEGTITKNRSRVSPQNLQFTFAPKTAELFKNSGFDAVSLANNHALDFGPEGLRQTHEYLDEWGIGFFGHPKNDPYAVLESHIKDRRIAFVGYHDVWGPRDPKPIMKVIRQLKKRNDRVFVYPHWGEEYKRTPNARQKSLAHQFIDAGADMVIGAHPHVVQSIEVYKGKPIFYSLGNFIFDQKFSKETMEGLLIRYSLDVDAEYVTIVPTVIHADLSVHAAPKKSAARQIAWLKKTLSLNGFPRDWFDGNTLLLSY